MPKFTVVAIEKFLVKTTYHNVEAANKSEAMLACQQGQESYDDKEILEGDEEWIETVSVEEETDDDWRPPGYDAFVADSL